MERPPSQDQGRVAMMARVLTSLTIQNVLTLGLLAVIAVPVFFAWKLMGDASLREALFSSLRVLEVGVPCLVMDGNFAGQPHRSVVLVVFDTDGRLEFDIVVRSPGQMTGPEIAKACEQARKYRDIMREAIGSPSEKK